MYKLPDAKDLFLALVHVFPPLVCAAAAKRIMKKYK
jgi:hypothetical protein